MLLVVPSLLALKKNRKENEIQAALLQDMIVNVPCLQEKDRLDQKWKVKSRNLPQLVWIKSLPYLEIQSKEIFLFSLEITEVPADVHSSSSSAVPRPHAPLHLLRQASLR